ncbi:MAG: STAS domain-containing protein [Spirochaetes bacterium]|nr:STAS domain-containing protein [Spirochaetota bacterium]
MKKKKSVHKDHVNFIFKKRLTIENVQNLHKELLAALSGAKSMDLQFKEVEEIDLSFIQLYCSFFRTTQEKNIKLTLKKPLPEAFVKVMIDAGFCMGKNDNLKCMDDCADLLFKED